MSPDVLAELSAAGRKRAELAEATRQNDALVAELIDRALDEGHSLAEIARQSGYHRNSIRTRRDARSR